MKVKKEIPFEVTLEDDIYIIQNDIFDIFSFNRDLEKAKIEIEEQIQFLWSEYVLANEEELAPIGLVLKNLLLNYIKEI
ncbi:hypothetical protein [Methanimicrococcus hongohii]|uniref:hypothetical protein n=1 Tax=Methanimicrococcus hongohii TaxID=3028295 RepID=UPI00292D5CF4|nr:hypothetical protein [Methanimicrococcus sp. Hf6]